MRTCIRVLSAASSTQEALWTFVALGFCQLSEVRDLYVRLGGVGWSNVGWTVACSSHPLYELPPILLVVCAASAELPPKHRLPTRHASSLSLPPVFCSTTTLLHTSRTISTADAVLEGTARPAVVLRTAPRLHFRTPYSSQLTHSTRRRHMAPQRGLRPPCRRMRPRRGRPDASSPRAA